MPLGILSRPMKRGTQIALFTLTFAFCTRAGAADALPPAPNLMLKAEQVGVASWYGQREAGHRTASGAIFDPAEDGSTSHPSVGKLRSDHAPG
jgi:hypothetical protein